MCCSRRDRPFRPVLCKFLYWQGCCWHKPARWPWRWNSSPAVSSFEVKLSGLREFVDLVAAKDAAGKIGVFAARVIIALPMFSLVVTLLGHTLRKSGWRGTEI